MRKIVVAAIVCASWTGIAGAYAQTRVRSTTANDYTALVTRGHGDAGGSVGREDQKVMGLSVPNGFRSPTTANGEFDHD